MKNANRFQITLKITLEQIKASSLVLLIPMSIWIFLQTIMVFSSNPIKWPFFESFGIFTISASVFLALIYLGILLLGLLLSLTKTTIPNFVNCILGSILGVVLIKTGGIVVGTIFYLIDNRNPYPLHEKFTSSPLFYIPITITIFMLAYLGWNINKYLIPKE